MAQVKKFQSGGTLTINGKQYTAQQINDYINQVGFNPEERAAIAGTVNAIASGAQVDLDRNANSLSGENVQSYFAGFYGNDKKAAKNDGRSAKWARRQARWNTDHNTVNHAISKLGGIEDYYSKKVEEKPESKLGMGSGWFTNEKGEYEETPTNLAKEKLIRQVYEHLSGVKKYDLEDGWGTNMDVLSNWYKEGMNAQDLIDAIKSGNLKADQLDALRLMGFTRSDLAKVQSDENKVKDKFVTAGYDYDKFRPYFDIDDKGRLIARTTADGQSVFSQLDGSGNYYFNDSFANAYKQYDFLKDHFLVDGKLYKSSDAGVEGSDLYNFLRTKNGFYDLNKKGDWEGANKLITHLWNGETNHALASDLTDTYSKFLYDNPTYRWASLTGAYDVPLAKGEQLLEVYDPSGNIDMFGYGTAKYAVLDKDGNLLRYVDSIGNPTGKQASAFSGRKIAHTESGDTIYDGKIVNDIVDKNNKYTGKTYFQDPETGDFIYRGRIIGASGVEGQDVKIPYKISDILNKNENFWKNLTSNPTLQKKFEANMGDLVNSGLAALFNDVLNEDEWINLGFTEPGQAAELVRLFKKYSKNKTAGNRTDRRQKRLVRQEQILKNGGLIVAKFAPGGTVKSTETKSHTARKVNSEFKNPENLARIGQDSFTGQDWAELVALGTDLGAIVAGVSGAPIASGVIGAAGSLTSFGADVSRDGLDLGDIGTLGLNLGLDLVSLLPLAGAAGQGVKVVSKIRKAAPIVLKTLALAGAGDATYTAATKIINGEDWNIKDVRNVVNALSGAIHIGKSGLLNRGSKSQKVTLDAKEISELKEKKALKEKIASEIGVQTKDLPKKLTPTTEERLGWKFWKGKQPTGKVVYEVTPTPDLKTIRGRQTAYNDWLKSGNVPEGVKPYVVLPNFIVGTDYVMPETPEWYSDAPTIEYVRERFKDGGKITKFQFPSGPIPKPTLSTNWDLPIKQNVFDSSMYKEVNKYNPTRFNYMTGKFEENPYYQSVFGSVTLKDPKSEQSKPEKKQTFGSQTSDAKPIDWEKWGAIGSAVGRIGTEAILTNAGINKQVSRAYENNRIAKSIYTSNVPEYYESFSDNGVKQAYDQNAVETENQAARDLTADPRLNRLFKRQASTEARALRLQGRLAQSKEYSDFRQRNLERRANYAAQRVANLNEDIKRHAQADVALQMELGRADALKTDMAKKAIADMANVYNKTKLAGIQSDYNQELRKYQDWYSDEKAKYDSGVKAGTITDYSSFDQYLEKNKALLDEQRRRYDNLAGYRSRATMYSAKKGGTLRPTSEQIKIDTEKAKHKAIAQLSKQAFELLKMALK